MTYMEVGNGRRVRPVNVPCNTGISNIRVGQNLRRSTHHPSLSVASRITRHVLRLAMLVIAATSLAHADSLIDPTRPPITVHKSGPAREVDPVVRVTAIFQSGERRVAVLDGQVVKVGDRVGAVTIQEINADGVRYLRAGRVEFARLPKQAAKVRRDAAGAEEDQ